MGAPIGRGLKQKYHLRYHLLLLLAVRHERREQKGIETGACATTSSFLTPSPVRMDSPIRRGLKQKLFGIGQIVSFRGPNGLPDQKGIETMDARQLRKA